MAAVLPAYQLPDEEELHTSFEDAISERVKALHTQLSHQSGLYTYIHDLDPIARPRKRTYNRQASSVLRLPASGWQRHISLTCLALIFMQLGFDLMGLLILHMH